MATLNGHDVRNTAGDVFESNDKIIVILRVSLVSFFTFRSDSYQT